MSSVSNRALVQDPVISAAAAAYAIAVDRLATSLAFHARALLDRVCTPNWTQEWRLPGWLVQILDLTLDQVASLTLSNGFGLTTVRLLDDLVDGEAGDEAPDTIVLLPAALHHLWVQQYRLLFDQLSGFWHYFERYLSQWIEATHGAADPPSTTFASIGDEDFRRLAHRGGRL
jgi:hypothetical protein